MLRNCWCGMKLIFAISPRLVILSMALSACTGVVLPLQLLLMQKMIDEIVRFTVAGDGSYHFLYLVVLLLLSHVGILFFKLWRNLALNKLNVQIDRELSEKILMKLSRIEYSYFENSAFFDTFERVRNQPGKAIFVLFQNLTGVCSVIVELAGVFCLISSVSLYFSVLYLLVLIYIAYMNFSAMNHMNTMFDSLTPEERLRQYYDELLSNKDNLYELRAFQAVDFILDKLKNMSKKVLRQRLGGTISAQRYSLLSNIGTVVWLACIVLFLFLQYSRGDIHLGLFVALLGSIESILSATEMFSSKVSDIAQNSIVGRHLSDFFALRETANRDRSQPIQKIKTIEFQHVYFKYPNAENYALEDICLKIDATKTYALVGENGSGKSTMIHLLCGLFPPESGKILINDIEMSRFGQSDLARMFSVVPQEYGRYQLSVRECVALGNLSFLENDAELRRAIHLAQGDSDFPELDKKLGKLDADSVDLSGGQWQKLAVARACLGESQYIIFDEPTAALDPRAESNLYEQMNRILHSRGCLFVSHRMASAVMSDQIVVLHRHRVAEQGTHKELLEINGLYAGMYTAQASIYQETGGSL